MSRIVKEVEEGQRKEGRERATSIDNEKIMVQEMWQCIKVNVNWANAIIKSKIHNSILQRLAMKWIIGTKNGIWMNEWYKHISFHWYDIFVILMVYVLALNL